MMSFFCFVNKRAIYRLVIISLAHAHVTDFPVVNVHLDELSYPEFQNMIRNHDILCFVETKTDDLDVINFPGFKFIMKNRKNIAYRGSGGIMVGYRDTLVKMIEIKETSCKYVLWFK